MNETDYNARLYEKMKAEQDKYREWLLHQEPSEILNHTYEYTMREDIVMCMEELELEPEKARALLRSPCPLSDVYKEFRDRETEHMDTIRDSIETEADEPLRPSMITAATHRKVIWQCKLGHEWTASVKSRTVNGTGCPYCSHNFVLPGFNDLASRFPEIAAEWSERNLPLTPDQVTAFKNIKVWWKCHLGHEWNTLISTRAGGSQCPYCSGIKLLKGFNDLKTKYPSLAAEWSEKNLPLTPDAVNEKSTKNVWWKCRTCGYEWKAVVKARVKGGMCPVCAERAVLQGYNDLGTTDPHLLSEWDYEKNSKWTPSNVSRNSMKVVWWKCGAGHSYRAKITDRTIPFYFLSTVLSV